MLSAEPSLAYLTWRSVGHTDDGGKIVEVGVIGHGTTGSELADHIATQTRAWNDHYRHPPGRPETIQRETVRFELVPASAATSTITTGQQECRFVVDQPHHGLAIAWH